MRPSSDSKPFLYRSQPCKELTPRLEKAVAAVQGVKLAKMNVDVEADIAGQLRVDVLPTLFLICEVSLLCCPQKTLPMR
jgi:thioredoxin-like negative regulator of GroEL